jgi:hypothetical protein
MRRVGVASKKERKRAKEEAMHIEDTQKLITEVEMLKVLLYLLS